MTGRTVLLWTLAADLAVWLAFAWIVKKWLL